MFHDERFHSIHLKKSNILNFIWFIQAMWFSIALFTIPLYLFEVFQSWEIIWQINSIAAWFWIITTLILSLLLWRFSRGSLFKIAILSITLSIIWFIVFSNFYEALWARSFLAIWWTIISSVISLYLKDIALKSNEDLWKDQWYLWVSKNIAWVLWPIWAWFLFDFIKHNKENIVSQFNFLWNWKHLEYNWLLYISIFFMILTFLIFIWAKFVNNNPHLQNKLESKETNKHYTLVNYKFILDFFQNKFRTLSFLNYIFLATWFWVFRWFIITLLMEDIWIDKKQIWIYFWLLSIPLVFFEWFLWKIIKKVWWSINALILWYWITAVFLIISIFVWYKNPHLFMLMLILSHIWIAILEPIYELQYFEWTNQENEAKFYSLHMIWWASARLILPAIFWIWITMIWIQKVYYAIPAMFSLFFIWLVVYKLKSKNK